MRERNTVGKKRSQVARVCVYTFVHSSCCFYTFHKIIEADNKLRSQSVMYNDGVRNIAYMGFESFVVVVRWKRQAFSLFS